MRVKLGLSVTRPAVIVIVIVIIIIVVIVIVIIIVVIVIIIVVAIIAAATVASVIAIQHNQFGAAAIKGYIDVFSAGADGVEFKPVENFGARAANFAFVNGIVRIGGSYCIQHSCRKAAQRHVIIAIKGNGITGRGYHRAGAQGGGWNTGHTLRITGLE